MRFLKEILMIVACMSSMISCQASEEEEKVEDQAIEEKALKGNKVSAHFKTVTLYNEHLESELEGSDLISADEADLANIAKKTKNDPLVNAKSTNDEIATQFVKHSFKQINDGAGLYTLGLVDLSDELKLELTKVLSVAMSDSAEVLDDETVVKASLTEAIGNLDDVSEEDLTTLMSSIVGRFNEKAAKEGVSSDALAAFPEQVAYILEGVSSEEFMTTIGFTADKASDVILKTSEATVKELSKGKIDTYAAIEKISEVFFTDEFKSVQENLFAGIISATQAEAGLDVQESVQAILKASATHAADSTEAVVSTLSTSLTDAGVSDASEVLTGALEFLVEEDPDNAAAYTAMEPDEDGTSTDVVSEDTDYSVAAEFSIVAEEIGGEDYLSTSSVSVEVSGVDDASDAYLAASEEACKEGTEWGSYDGTVTGRIPEDSENSEVTLYIKFKNEAGVASDCIEVGSVNHDNEGPSEFSGVEVAANAPSASTAPTISWEALEDEGAGFAYVAITVVKASDYSLQGGPVIVTEGTSYQMTSGLSMGIGVDHKYLIQAYDYLGNGNTAHISSSFAPQSWVTKTGDEDDGAYGQDMDLELTGSGDTVTDNVTGLVWEKVGDGSSAVNYSDAESYCESLSLGGIEAGEWRVPGVLDFVTIMSKHSNSYSELPLDDLFEYSEHSAGGSDRYWTSDAKNATEHFGFAFQVGSFFPISKTTSSNQYVKCVHGELPERSFSTDGDEVTEASTGLVFQKAATNTAGSQPDSESHCTGLGGGWRIPTLKEQAVMLDFSEDNYKFTHESFTWTSNNIWSATHVHGTATVDANHHIISFYNSIASVNSGSNQVICVK